MMNNNFNNGATNNNSYNNGGFIMSTGTINTVDLFADVVKAGLEEAHPDCGVMVHKVTKNNNLVLTGISIRSKEVNLAPTIYMDGYYNDYKNGRPMVEILAEVERAYNTYKAEQDFDVSSITDFNLVQDKICYKLVNRDKNKELLADAPYLPFCDLAVIFYVVVSEDSVGTGTVTIHNNLMEMWGNPDIKELYQVAKNNTQRRYKGRVSNMMEIMGEIISSDVDNLDPDMVDAFFEMDSVYEDNMVPMFVATNSKKVNGAGVILYDGLLRTFAEKIGGDFFILPSSVHEVIFVPANGDMDARYLIQMVKEVNATEVSPDEVLSDNVYMYHADEDRVEMM